MFDEKRNQILVHLRNRTCDTCERAIAKKRQSNTKSAQQTRMRKAESIAKDLGTYHHNQIWVVYSGAKKRCTCHSCRRAWRQRKAATSQSARETEPPSTATAHPVTHCSHHCDVSTKMYCNIIASSSHAAPQAPHARAVPLSLPPQLRCIIGRMLY